MGIHFKGSFNYPRIHWSTQQQSSCHKVQSVQQIEAVFPAMEVCKTFSTLEWFLGLSGGGGKVEDAINSVKSSHAGFKVRDGALEGIFLA